MPANQAGKGPQPRAYDTSEYGAGVERIFGKRKPWWEARDERNQMGEPAREGSAGAPMNWEPPSEPKMSAEAVAKKLASEFMKRGQYEGVLSAEDYPDPEPFTPYQVPIIRDATFGNYVSLPFKDEIVLVLSRGFSGWHVPRGFSYARHPHQVRVDELSDAAHNSKELVVVGLNTGTWVTVWASSPSEITHPWNPVS